MNYRTVIDARLSADNRLSKSEQSEFPGPVFSYGIDIHLQLVYQEGVAVSSK